MLAPAQQRRLKAVARGCCSTARAHHGAHDPPSRRATVRPAAAAASGEYPSITVAGSSFEMGQQHGSQAREIVGRYLAYIIAGSAKTREDRAWPQLAWHR